MTTMSETTLTTWVRVCAVSDLTPERGRAALLDDGMQVALFQLTDGTVRAVSNRDPYSGAHVISRGLVGSAAFEDGTEVPTVASPLHKQAWDLVTGRVLRAGGADERHLRTFPVAIDSGHVLVRRRV